MATLCLCQIPPLEGYRALQTLELSYNSISSLQQLIHLQSTDLEELYVANNTVQQIEVWRHAEGRLLPEHVMMLPWSKLCVLSCTSAAGIQRKTQG